MRREGLGMAALDRVTQTLRAASLTKEAREQLKHGRLTEELKPPGFEALASVPAPARRGKRRPPETEAKDRDDARQAIARARERVRALRADEHELAREAAARNREAAKAEEHAVAKRKEAERAQEASDEAAVARADAEKGLERLAGR
jgi:CHASE3 domain sensor protein